MKKTFRIIIAALLVLVMAAAAMPAFAEGEKVETEPVRGASYENEYIKVTVNTSNGRLSSYTTADNRKLLYGVATDPTSYSTIAIGNSTYKYGTNLAVTPDFNGKTNYSAQNYSGVYVEQRLTVVPNEAGEESIVEWRYTYTNNTNTNQTVGCRIMLDVCLEDTAGDDAAYRLPNLQSITSETTLTTDIPRSWFTYHPNKDLSAQGGFYEGQLMPDMLQFGMWHYSYLIFWGGGLYDTEWNYETEGRDFGDSAVAATWSNKVLAPGESIDFVTYYGLGNVLQEGEGDLTIHVNGDVGCVANEDQDGYIPSPAYIMGILSNVGNGPLTGVYERCELPEGLSFVPGTDPTYYVGDMAAGSEAQNTWNFTVDEVSEEDRVFDIYIFYGCDGNEEAYVIWHFYVPGVEVEPEPDPIPPTVTGEKIEIRSRTDRDAKADLRFIFRVDFNDSNIVYKGNTYGPAEDFSITDFYSVVTVNNKTARVNGKLIYEMFDEEEEPYYLYTVVVKNVLGRNFDVEISATPFIEYVKVATGETGMDTDEPLISSVNEVINN